MILVSVTFGIGVGILSAVRREDLDRLSRQSRGHPGAGRAVLLAGHPGGGAPRHLLALDAAVDLCAAEHRCPGEPQDYDFPGARIRGVTGRADHADHALGDIEVQRQDYIRTAWAKGLPSAV